MVIDNGRETWRDVYDGVIPFQPGDDEEGANGIKPTPFGSVEGDLSPLPREFVYGWHYVRGYLVMDVGESAIGKTIHRIVEAVAMASGRNLLGVDVRGPSRVAYLNAEDDRADMVRKVNAVMKYYGLGIDDLADGAGNVRLLLLGLGEWDAPQSVQDYDLLARAISDHELDVLFLDPWVSMNKAGENTNEDVDLYAKRLSEIAAEMECCISVAHHTRKPQPGSGAHTTTDDARGAGALKAASRSARAFSRMKEGEATNFDIKDEERPSFYFTHRDNSNVAPVGNRRWHRMTEVDLENDTDALPSDKLGVPVTVSLEEYEGAPDDVVKDATRTLAGLQATGTRFRTNEQAQPPETWLGDYIIDACNLDVKDEAPRKWVKKVIADWERAGTIEKGYAKDRKSEIRPYFWLRYRLDITGTDADLGPSPYAKEKKECK